MYIVFTENASLYLGTYEQWQGEILEIESNENPFELLMKANSCKSSKIFLPWSFDELSKKCKLVSAAGGLVSHQNKLLFIKKNDVWDLPKGWIDEGEYPMQTAMREVIEECGDISLMIQSPKPYFTYHLYKNKKKVILKKTFWYRMGCQDDFKLKPQTKEGISEVSFIAFNKIPNLLKQSYPMIRHLCQSYFSEE